MLSIEKKIKECMLCIIKSKMLFSEITKSQLYRHQRSQCTWKVTIASLRKVAAVFGADMSQNADLNSLNLRTQTLPRRLFWLQ